VNLLQLLVLSLELFFCLTISYYQSELRVEHVLSSKQENYFSIRHVTGLEFSYKFLTYVFLTSRKYKKSRDSAIGLAIGYGLDDREVGVQVPVGAIFFSFHVIYTGSVAHLASYPMGTGGKAAGV
jgi:hypothetical protein